MEKEGKKMKSIDDDHLISLGGKEKPELRKFAHIDNSAWAQESIATSLVAADPTFSVVTFALGKQLSIAHRQSMLSNSQSFYSASLVTNAACHVFMPGMTNRRSDPRPCDWADEWPLFGPVKGISITSDRIVLLYGSCFVAVDHLSLLTTIKRRHHARYINPSETDCKKELVYEKWNASNSWKAIA
uniref:Uncharacterized protein n=1 Tax=Trichuris muris TaxID=70415 RepID=A0A5S6QAU6_TRIMR